MFDRLEDKEVRRASRKARLDPVVDEDSADEEDYDFPLDDVTKPSRTPQAERTSRPRTPDVRSVDEDSVTGINGRTTAVTVAPASVGSALRKNANGGIATPKLLPKRNKDSKVGETTLRLALG